VKLAFWVAKDDDKAAGTLQWTSLMGGDKEKLMRKLDLSKVLPASRAQSVSNLWKMFMDVYDKANSKKL